MAGSVNKAIVISEQLLTPSKKITRFLRKVEAGNYSEHLCWIWKGAQKGNGYGNVRIGGRNIGAHRLSFILFFDEDVSGMDVCHKCDNRICVNPYHLFAGTRQANMWDAVSKNRQAKGEALPQTKVFGENLKDVLRRVVAGEKYSSIAESHGVRRATINKIALVRGIKRKSTKKSDFDKWLEQKSGRPL